MTKQPAKKRHQRIAALRKEAHQAQKTNFATTLTLLGLFSLFYYILNKLEFLEDKNTLVTFIAGGLAADLASSTAPAVYETGLLILSNLLMQKSELFGANKNSGLVKALFEKQKLFSATKDINKLKEKERLLLEAAEEQQSFKM